MTICKIQLTITFIFSTDLSSISLGCDHADESIKKEVNKKKQRKAL
ncbi:conserved hypothetical protein [Trichinella spiralis]|nr:conserved hypothetical protein [Trichinella spiralis]